MSIALVIDDNPETRSLVATLLQRAGYKTVEAKNGIEGVNLSRAVTPEVVVTDIFMPGQDGLHVLMQIKKSLPDTRIVAVSGGSSRFPGLDVLGLAERLGADATLDKPFTPYELMQAVTGLPVLN
jgi:CheY-like chemotaxis protein